MEIWKCVNGLENIIMVSNKGRVYNKAKNKIMKQFLSGSGYKTISLWFGNKNNRKNYLVHRLVAMAFIQNEQNLPQVNHIDGNKENNNVNNLEWCDASYNNTHAVRIGLRTYKDRMKPVLQIKNGEIIKEYCSLKDACRQNNIDTKTMWAIVNNKPHYKTANGFQWKYK